MTNIHYALQACDLKSYQSPKRFCGDDRTLLSKKSISSLIRSIEYCADLRSDSNHVINIIKDTCSPELTLFLDDLVRRVDHPRVTITLSDLAPLTGVVDSIRACYQWLAQNGKDLVFQVQDDYLFSLACLHDSIEHFYTVLGDTKTQCIIQPYNDITYWHFLYKNRSTPRLISLGKKGYWIQIYDTSCSFLTSHGQFQQHWDLYERFFELIPTASSDNPVLENRSLNCMFTQRGVLGLAPMNTLSHHMQMQPDLYVDWQPLWHDIQV